MTVDKLTKLAEQYAQDHLFRRFMYAKDYEPYAAFVAGYRSRDEEVRVLREALEWYANTCWSCEQKLIDTCHGSPEFARTALKATKDE